MKKNQGLIIGIAVLVFLFFVVALLGVFFFFQYTNSYEYHLKLAQKYLLEEDYEQAIAEYEIAISIDPTQKDAYAELAELYIELEEYEDAIEILEEGYEETEAKGLSRKVETVKKLFASKETEDADITTQDEAANAFIAETGTKEQVSVADTTTGEVTQAVAETTSEVGQEVQVAPESSVDFYSVATSKSKEEVEEFAKKVKKLFLEHKWSNLAEMMVYPIEIGGVTYSANPDIIRAGFNDIYKEAFMEALEAEDCESMYCDSNGIRLGNGEVWIADVDWNGSRQLKIVAINDFCSESSQKKKEENTVAQDGSGMYQEFLNSLIADNKNNITDYGNGRYYYYDFDEDGCVELLVERVSMDLSYADIEVYGYKQGTGVYKIHENSVSQGGITGFVKNGYATWSMGGSYSGCDTYVYRNSTFKVDQSYWYSSMDPNYEKLKQECSDYMSDNVFSVTSNKLF